MHSPGGAAMPRLIWFILTRFITGFALGCVTGLLIWQIRIGAMGYRMVFPDSFIAQGLFIYLFASTIGLGYMATALWIENSE
jgi:NhaP-type Na+/H+ or K+/H+ antiporter